MLISRLGVVLLALLLVSCGGPSDNSPDFSSAPPSKLQALTSVGIVIHASVIVSTEPNKQYDLTLDPSTNNFTGVVKVKTGVSFDLTVIYTADDPVTGRELEIAHYVRRNLVATGPSMSVAYAGDETNWETLFDLSPGSPNDLNLDGDAYYNFVEIGYGSDATKSDSLPLGATASGTHKDPLFGTADVGLPPPGSDLVSALRGDSEITISANTLFDIKSIEIVSPTFGYESLSTDEEIIANKQLQLLIHTAQFVVGPNVGEMSIIVRVTDEFGLIRETTLTFAVYNLSGNCGNGTKSSGEECDDGNTNSGDGCDSLCKIELPILSIASPVEGTVQDIVDLSATALSKFGVEIQSLRVTSPSGLTDQNNRSDTFESTWDTRAITPDDQQIELRFETRDTGGRTSIALRRVTVDNYPNIRSFTTSNGTTDILIQEGEETDLSWQVDNATTVTIDSGIVGTFTGTGSTTVFPLNTTTYTLTATRTNNLVNPNPFTTTAQLTVRVNHDPTFDGEATDELGQLPDNVTIGWTRSDQDTGDTVTSTVELFNGPGCAGDPVDIEATSGSTWNLTSLDPRADYSYQVSLDDGRAGTGQSGCLTFTTSDDGLVGWWRMDEGSGEAVLDRSGNGNDGTLYGTPIWADGSLQFDGGDDYLTIPHDASLDNLGDAGSGFSFEIWFKTATIDILVDPEQLIHKGDGTRTFGMNLDPGTDGLNFEVLNTVTGTNEGVSSGDVVDGNWHQAVVTVGGGDLRLYVDGRLEDVSTYPENIPFSNIADILVGTSGGDRFFEGVMDEIAFYERALSVDEIRRSCRRTDPSNICPNEKEPIILTPLPGQTLPPTRAFWSWRGERDVEGELLYPSIEYEALYDRDNGNDGQFIAPTDSLNNPISSPLITQNIDGSEFTVLESNVISSSKGYRIHVRPIENGTTLTSLESTRLFSTDDSVVAWYNFDTDSLGIETDRSGNGNTGDWSGHPLDGTPAQIVNGESCIPSGPITELILGAAVCLDGMNDYLTIPHAAFPDIGATGVDFSIGVRLNTASDGSVESLFSKVETSGNSNEVALTLNGATPKFELNNTLGENLTLYANATINDQEWHYVVGAVVFDATATVRLAVDGQNEATGTYSTGWNFNNTADLLMGRYRINTGNYYNGLIDELVIYNKALSGEDILNSYCAIEALAETDPLPEVCTD